MGEGASLKVTSSKVEVMLKRLLRLTVCCMKKKNTELKAVGH
jgi:hypothetical protein